MPNPAHTCDCLYVPWSICSAMAQALLLWRPHSPRLGLRPLASCVQASLSPPAPPVNSPSKKEQLCQSLSFFLLGDFMPLFGPRVRMVSYELQTLKGPVSSTLSREQSHPRPPCLLWLLPLQMSLNLTLCSCYCKSTR